MNRTLFVMTKGKFEQKDLCPSDFYEWFKKRTNSEGRVEPNVMIYEDCQIKTSQQGMLWTLSDDTLDRDSERFDTAGWKLEAFKLNPVVLWGHDDSRPAIGSVLNPIVVGNRLEGRIVFSTKEIDPFAWMVEQKIKAGTIRAGSVGFKPLKIELIEDDKDPCKLIYKEQELREFSICNVPANPMAVHQPGKQSEHYFSKVLSGKQPAYFSGGISFEKLFTEKEKSEQIDQDFFVHK